MNFKRFGHRTRTRDRPKKTNSYRIKNIGQIFLIVLLVISIVGLIASPGLSEIFDFSEWSDECPKLPSGDSDTSNPSDNVLPEDIYHDSPTVTPDLEW